MKQVNIFCKYDTSYFGLSKHLKIETATTNRFIFRINSLIFALTFRHGFLIFVRKFNSLYVGCSRVYFSHNKFTSRRDWPKPLGVPTSSANEQRASTIIIYKVTAVIYYYSYYVRLSATKFL
jgi:hypothetical protein